MTENYEEAKQILEKNKEYIMSILGVHGIGVGKGSNYGGDPTPCFVIYIDTNADETPIPKEIERIPVYVVRTEPFEALD